MFKAIPMQSAYKMLKSQRKKKKNTREIRKYTTTFYISLE